MFFRVVSQRSKKSKRERYKLKMFGYFLYDCIIMQRGVLETA
nr:MAG TPA: hypothetical protein [Caudoviricetes sp.]